MMRRFFLALSAVLLTVMMLLPTAEAAKGDIALPTVEIGEGMSVTRALDARHSAREYSDKALTAQQLSKILWAANGINRPETGGRVNPAAHGKYFVDVYALTADGIYLYAPKEHALKLVVEGDYRSTMGGQQFARTAPLNLVYVTQVGSMRNSPHGNGGMMQARYVGVTVGAMIQSVALVLEAEGLGGCVRGSFDAEAFAKAAQLDDGQRVFLSQAIGALK